MRRDTPRYIGQFPALAFAIYNRHVTPAPFARRLGGEEIYEGVDALSQDFTGGGYDIKELTGNLKTPGECPGRLRRADRENGERGT